MSELTPTERRILVALKNGENHGYGIARETDIAFGTLYRTVGNLIESGLIEVSREDADSPRRYYRITAAGKRAIESSGALS